MLVVGLTGGIASGKSLVARTFRDLGSCVYDADKIVRELTEPDEPAWQDIVSHFGIDILLKDRTIDRRKLGEIVFHAEHERMWLNACIHPRVFDSFMSQVHALRNRPQQTIIVLDAALLIETGYHRRVDRVVVVYADRPMQIERLMLRDTLTREQALARINSQMPLEIKKSFADYIIDNTLSREHAIEQSKAVYARLQQEVEKGHDK